MNNGQCFLAKKCFTSLLPPLLINAKILLAAKSGEIPKRLKGTVSKTVSGVMLQPGFESLFLRQKAKLGLFKNRKGHGSSFFYFSIQGIKFAYLIAGKWNLP